MRKSFWRIGFCSFIFEFRELKLFKPEWTFQNQTTRFCSAWPTITVLDLISSSSFSAKCVARVEKFTEEKVNVSASLQELWFFIFFLTRETDFAEKEGLLVIYTAQSEIHFDQWLSHIIQLCTSPTWMVVAITSLFARNSTLVLPRYQRVCTWWKQRNTGLKISEKECPRFSASFHCIHWQHRRRLLQLWSLRTLFLFWEKFFLNAFLKTNEVLFTYYQR